MSVRVLSAGAAKVHARESIEGKLARLEMRVLSGEDQRRCDAARDQRARDGLQFDGFRPGADDQPNVRGTQPSP
jgi:hypothetical protein